MAGDLTVLITGGSGFIGSNFIHYLSGRRPDWRIINLDKLTYASNPDNLKGVDESPHYRSVQGDICDAALVDEVMAEADAVFNFAAETHVDRSLMDAGSFILTDVLGPYVLLESARRHPNV
ncbi:MAG: GDP-mannose 4,6-dehydratase, partial [Dehalococcoidia bacterium]